MSGFCACREDFDPVLASAARNLFFAATVRRAADATLSITALGRGRAVCPGSFCQPKVASSWAALLGPGFRKERHRLAENTGAAGSARWRFPQNPQSSQRAESTGAGSPPLLLLIRGQ